LDFVLVVMEEEEEEEEEELSEEGEEEMKEEIASCSVLSFHAASSFTISSYSGKGLQWMPSAPQRANQASACGFQCAYSSPSRRGGMAAIGEDILLKVDDDM
jgi:hypothetical protein